MDGGWTLDQDEELRAACERAGGDLSLKKLKWWEDLARGFPGTNAKGLQQVAQNVTAAGFQVERGSLTNGRQG